MNDYDIVATLMQRDGLRKHEAVDRLEEARLIHEELGLDPEDVLREELGLEPDYLFDFLNFKEYTMRDLSEIVADNRHAAEQGVLIGSAVGVGEVKSRGVAYGDNRKAPDPATHDAYVNPRTGAVVGIPKQ